MCVVHGVEYGYGAHEHSSTGIFKVEPRKCPGFTFRKSILVGETEMKAKEVGSVMEELADEYQGSKYHLITRNCNHFCNDVCLKLTQKSIPNWVNRLARLGIKLETFCLFITNLKRRRSIELLFFFCLFMKCKKVSCATVCYRLA